MPAAMRHPDRPNTRALCSTTSKRRSRRPTPGAGRRTASSWSSSAARSMKSDRAFRHATRTLGLILANHVVSAIDALVTCATAGSIRTKTRFREQARACIRFAVVHIERSRPPVENNSVIEPDQIVEYLRNEAGRPLKAKELANGLGVTPDDYPEFKDQLQQLEDQGLLYRVQKQRYAAPKKLNLVVGRLRPFAAAPASCPRTTAAAMYSFRRRASPRPGWRPRRCAHRTQQAWCAPRRPHHQDPAARTRNAGRCLSPGKEFRIRHPG